MNTTALPCASRRCNSVILLLLLCAALMPSTCTASLKPLSVADRLKFAKHVFLGTVESVEFKDLNRAPNFPDWITRHYKCVVVVDKVVQTTKHSRPNPSHPADEAIDGTGTRVHVMVWKGVGRPDDFVGDRGTLVVPEVGKQYAFATQFLHFDPHLRHMYHDSYPHVEDEGMKAYNVLMPNGIASADDFINLEPKRDL